MRVPAPKSIGFDHPEIRQILSVEICRISAGFLARVVWRNHQGNPIAAVGNGSALDIFVLGSDGVVRTAFRDGTGWHWSAVEGAAFSQGNPIAAVRG